MLGEKGKERGSKVRMRGGGGGMGCLTARGLGWDEKERLAPAGWAGFLGEIRQHSTRPNEPIPPQG